jgi:septum formation protein
VLRALGVDFVVDPADVDEQRHPDESPVAFVERLARAKAEAVAVRHPGARVLGGDTIVIVDDHVLGKPTDEAHASDMLLRLQGRDHTVMTSLALLSKAGVVSGVDQTRVRFRSFDRRTAEGYVATGESMDKAGAYGIQGRGAALVRAVDGDYFTVMGFSVSLFVDLLGSSGLRLLFGAVEPDSPRSVS